MIVDCPECHGSGLGRRRDVDRYDVCLRCFGDCQVEVQKECPECGENIADDQDFCSEDCRISYKLESMGIVPHCAICGVSLGSWLIANILCIACQTKRDVALAKFRSRSLKTRLEGK